MATTPATIFVVDDDASVRKSLTRMLFTFGYRVVAAESAAEFLRLAVNAPHPCSLILDVKLPDLDGLDLQTQLNRDGLLMPIIFITGHGDLPMGVKAMKAGAVDFLSKPFRPLHLLEAVQAALDRDRKESERQGEMERIKVLKARLTPREREVMDLVVTGLTNKEIAAQLGLVVQTVKVHRGRMMSKMGVSSVAGLVRLRTS